MPTDTVVVVDDLDALIGRYPLDHAQAIAERLERLARGAGDAGVRLVVGVQRPAGASARVAELIPRRLLLASATRADHLAAGGSPELWRRDLPPGRGELDGRAVQVALANGFRMPAAADVPRWQPSEGLTGLVVRGGMALPSSLGGHRIVDVRSAAEPAELRDATRTIVVGDPESWQRAWRVLDAVRDSGELLIDASCGPDYRALTGDRDLPPYCTPGAGRAWLIRPGIRPTRVQWMLSHP